jgi:hypothetical protein
MKQQEKAKQFAEEHAGNLGMEKRQVESIWIEGSRSGYIAGRKNAIKEMDDIVETRARVRCGCIAEIFEELLRDRVQIKELRDWWRYRAGLPIPEEDE